MLTKILAAELAADNIQANVIAPGYIISSFMTGETTTNDVGPDFGDNVVINRQ
jgi:NAD(P)-dependent dehydrogenase (short-subunit alcohol dehydrogenase family)